MVSKPKNTKSKTLNPQKLDKVKADYLKGLSREEICSLYKITYKQLDHYIRSQNWNEKRREITRKTEEKFADLIADSKARALAEMNEEAREIIQNCMKEFRNASNWQTKFSTDDNGRETITIPYAQLAALGKLWRDAWNRRLRSLGEADSIKDVSDFQGEATRPILQVLTMVGIKPEAVEKVIHRAGQVSDKED
ncbi:hypothetical protein [Leptospira licerasiae]|uniref:Terminase n=1 Tax=Leptospira licerasiae str. MMD4847 TaxID=1049971 RepID=A0ABP2RCT6_9LEPT|nr:hypothetical protein [Leptospira licerasiae]EIE01412.1 hypothetical protein LEP1GSC185_3912 [Leptospira licerasiae serovar Varillal str. VAR 010]EJZ42319.1 hypothetical protein LEP1GSC178_0077 [Leptospira licerasiae str. MMD4847]